MTSAIPDGPAKRPFTLEEGWRRQKADVLASRQRGVLNTVTTPSPSRWVQYSRGVSGALNLQWQAVGGYSLSAGALPPGVTWNGNGGWTLPAGFWDIKAGLRVASSTSGMIFALSSTNTGTEPNPHPGAEIGLPNIATGTWGSLAIDLPVTSAMSVYPWVYITNSTPAIVDGYISFWKKE